MTLPIVFIHGASSDPTSWDDQKAYFSKTRGVTVPDLTSFDNIGVMGDHVLATAPAEFILCGTSMGGYVAFDVLKKAQGRVKTSILCNTTARADAPERKRQRQMEVNAGEEAYKEARKNDDHYKAFLSEKSAQDKALVARLRAISQRVGYGCFSRHQKACAERVESLSYLPEINMPVLVMGGSEDKLIPLDLQREIQQGIKGAQLVAIDGTGHITNMEKPADMNTAIETFLKQVAA
ncbi:MAG: alpha/beta fold hydrolase [Alphaproteobacteria bacterium]